MRISDWSSDVCSSDLATCTESVTGLSEAAWLAGEDCDDVALSPLPPQAASSSAGASTSIAYDAARGVDIGFDMENFCRWLRPGVRGGSDSKSADVQSWKRPRDAGTSNRCHSHVPGTSSRLIQRSEVASSIHEVGFNRPCRVRLC